MKRHGGIDDAGRIIGKLVIEKQFADQIAEIAVMGFGHILGTEVSKKDGVGKLLSVTIMVEGKEPLVDATEEADHRIPDPLGSIRVNGRGYGIVEFVDSREVQCSLQQSSGTTCETDTIDRPGASCVWLGRDPDRMHLGRDKVESLVAHLTNWLETGEFQSDEQ